MTKKKSNLNRKTSKFVQFTGAGLQLGAVIYVGSWFGGWLDKNHPTEGVSYFKILTLIAVLLGTISLIRQVIKLGKEE